MRRVVGCVAWVMTVACTDYSSADSAKSDAGVGDATTSIPDGGAAVAPPPAGCDENADARDALACIDDTYVIFVDPTHGDDASPGTKARPVKSIIGAVPLATADGRSRIYVCGADPIPSAQTIANVTITRLAGGFDCMTWLPSGTPASIAPQASSSAALALKNLARPIRIEDLTITAAPGDATTPSSVGLFAFLSASVTLTRVTVNAGMSKAGAVGGVPTAVVRTPADGSGAGSTLAGGAAKTCACASGKTVGGKGGNATGSVLGGFDGAQGMPLSMGSGSAIVAGKGQTSAQCSAASPATGGTGASGPRGGDAGKSTVIGRVDEQGWHGADGAVGEAGGIGQGGGGGGGGAPASGPVTMTGGGGSGGCGGCEGAPGSAGGAGGSSIGVLVVQTPLVLVASTIATREGADGGSGTSGLVGGTGGAGGAGSGGGCKGGAGGNGGPGGAGAGGAGGVSVGVFYTQVDKPTAEGATIIKTGAFGAGGLGGNAGVNDGPAGLSGEIVEVPASN